IYSLGATLYHMVTGRPPFTGKTIDEVLDAHLDQELIPPDHINRELSAGLGEVVEIMIAKDKAERYQTPADLIADLECLLAGAPPRLARQRMMDFEVLDPPEERARAGEEEEREEGEEEEGGGGEVVRLGGV